MTGSNELQLYSAYSETGHQGANERWETCSLSVGDGNVNAVATLTVVNERRSFPANGDEVREETRYEIGVQDLEALIRQHGRRI
jgi:hypothetical protein